MRFGIILMVVVISCVFIPVVLGQDADDTASNALAIALVNKLDMILLSLGTFVAATGGLILNGIVAARQARLQQAQLEATRQSARMDEKMEFIKHTTNGLTTEAQKAAYEQGILEGIHKERERIALEQAAHARGRDAGMHEAIVRAHDLASIPPELLPRIVVDPPPGLRELPPLPDLPGTHQSHDAPNPVTGDGDESHPPFDDPKTRGEGGP
jgi:hypothetical protein